MTDDLVLNARRRSQPWPTLVFALLTVAAVLGLELAREHQRVRAEQVSRLRTQVTVVTDNLARQLLGVKNALDGIRSDIAPPDKRPPPQLMAQRLQALSEAMPGVRGIMVLDAQGQVVGADRQDLSRRNFVDRPYFSAPRNEPLYARLYVSAPFRSILGRFSLNLTRAMTHPDGSFAGVVTANLDADYVEILARSVLYSPDMHLSILHGDGELFLDAHQEPPVLTSADFTAAAAALALVKAKPGEVVVTQMDDGAGAQRLLVVGAVQPSALDMDKPLLVAASRRLSDVYAPWRDQAVDYGLIFLLLSAGILSTVYFVEQRRNTAYLAGLERQRMAAVNARTLQFGLEGADLGFWEWNARTDTITVNTREAEILGYADGELELKPELWKELIPASEWDVVFAAFKNHVKASAAAFSGEHRIRRKDGRLVWVQSHAVVSERDGRNRPLQILGTHLDISEKKAAEQAIHDTAQRLELAMETGRMGLVDLHVATGALIVNARGFEIVGWPATESAEIDIGRWRSLLHPDDVARVDATFEPTLAGLTQSRSCEYRLRHSAGHDVWVQMRARAVALDPDGKAARVVGAFQDITEARQASTRLAEAAELQRRTGSLARVGGWQFDVASAQMTWTDELYEIHELPVQPVTLESSMAFYLPPGRAALRQAVQEALAHGTAWCLDAQITTALGNPLWVRTQGEAVGAGWPGGAAGGGFAGHHRAHRLFRRAEGSQCPAGTVDAHRRAHQCRQP
ncbi:MAG: hypothetical protein JWP29_5458 [Rhodoferax sp.]|nr:hypothetical protein [Rhodoferax sp.]